MTSGSGMAMDGINQKPWFNFWQHYLSKTGQTNHLFHMRGPNHNLDPWKKKRVDYIEKHILKPIIKTFNDYKDNLLLFHAFSSLALFILIKKVLLNKKKGKRKEPDPITLLGFNNNDLGKYLNFGAVLRSAFTIVRQDDAVQVQGTPREIDPERAERVRLIVLKFATQLLRLLTIPKLISPPISPVPRDPDVTETKEGEGEGEGDESSEEEAGEAGAGTEAERVVEEEDELAMAKEEEDEVAMAGEEEEEESLGMGLGSALSSSSSSEEGGSMDTSRGGGGLTEEDLSAIKILSGMSNTEQDAIDGLLGLSKDKELTKDEEIAIEALQELSNVDMDQVIARRIKVYRRNEGESYNGYS